MSADMVERRRQARRSLAAEIVALEREIAAQDADEKLMGDAEEIADDEVEAVTEGGDADVDESLGSENEKANDNWPMTDAEKEKVARRLVTLAKALAG